MLLKEGSHSGRVLRFTKPPYRKIPRVRIPPPLQLCASPHFSNKHLAQCASASPQTILTPAFFRLLAASLMLAPLVNTSSTNNTFFPFTFSSSAIPNAPSRLVSLSPNDINNDCCLVFFSLTSHSSVLNPIPFSI